MAQIFWLKAFLAFASSKLCEFIVVLMDGGSSIHCESGTISFLSSLLRKYIFNFFFLANLFCIQAWAFICGKRWQQIYVYLDLFYRISKMFQKTTKTLASIENRTFTFFKVQNIFERSKYIHENIKCHADLWKCFVQKILSDKMFRFTGG